MSSDVVSPPSARPPSSRDIDLAAFLRSIGEEPKASGAVLAFVALVVRLDDEGATGLAFVDELAAWLHAPEPLGVRGPAGVEEPRTERLRLLVRALRAAPPFREAFARLLARAIAGLRGASLFTEVGIPVEPGFWREVVDRVAARLLPSRLDPASPAELLRRLAPTAASARWLRRAPPEPFEELLEQLERTASPPSRAFGGIARGMAEAVWILAARVAALGVAADVRARLPEIATADSPFLRLARVCDGLPLAGPPRGAPAGFDEAASTIAACRAALDRVRHHLEEFGVSVDLVYRLELVEAELVRLERLLAVFTVTRASRVGPDLARLLFELCEAERSGRSLRALVRTSAHVLARKIVERTGKTGEHYIGVTRAEWRAMLLAGAGGGVVTAFTAMGKVAVVRAALPAFFAGLGASLDYTASFVLMTALGFSLATKQPSMTAAALAGAIDPRSHAGGAPPDHEPLVTLGAQIARSQLAAMIGNVGVVVPTALAIDAAHRALTGAHFVTPDEAEHLVASLDPLHSGTIPFAVLTGVLLWASSLAAGWLENWVAYRRLPEAIAHDPRLVARLGAVRARRLGDAVARGSAAFGGNVAIGFLLGMTPAIGLFFGLPVEVRHVTLSTGTLALALAGGGAAGAHGASAAAAALGIATIGLANFGVAFALALGVAMRARGVRSTALGPMLRAVARRLRASPGEFFFPPRGAEVRREP